MLVCMCVFMVVCVCVFMVVCECVCSWLCVCVYGCVCVCMFVCVCSCLCVCVHGGVSVQRLEADLSYWMDHTRSRDQGRHPHYDHNSPISPRYTASHRHGHNLNYAYY